MKPTDFPIERLGRLQTGLISASDSALRNARSADAQGQPVSGFYEAALAYAESARHVGQTAQEVATDIDRAALREQEPAHPWPLERLQNLVSIHRDGSEPPAPTEFRQRYPRWGIVEEEVDDRSRTLYVTPSGYHDGVILTATEGNGTEYGLKTAIHLAIDFEQWDQLAALVARIRAGHPIPYDAVGNTRTKEGTP